MITPKALRTDIPIGKPLGTVWIATYLVVAADDVWPFDVGDDPSFRKYLEGSGPVTWGICRQDVRNALNPGDLVVHFSAKRVRGLTEYKLASAAIVQNKIKQTEIWETDEYKRFRSYWNLLITPSEGGYMHFEHPVNRRCWHDDWQWRLCEKTGLNKSNVSGLLDSDRLTLECAENYILFDPSQTFVLDRPPTVAFAAGTKCREEWLGDPVSVALKAILLERFGGRHLRTTNPQQPHRHIRLREQDTFEWFCQFTETCEQLGLNRGLPDASNNTP